MGKLSVLEAQTTVQSCFSLENAAIRVNDSPVSQEKPSAGSEARRNFQNGLPPAEHHELDVFYDIYTFNHS